ncbi:malonyl-CoA decarboxylase [Rhodobacteraceae bacterium]|nr:malonyl-CoA decarboxylase [Paracoccaceae bacterium]
MAARSFLGDMLTTLFERRQTATNFGDNRSLSDMCRSLLDAEGEISGLKLAQAILDRYARLTPDETLEFFLFLNNALEVDMAALNDAIVEYGLTQSMAGYAKISALSESPRQELLRRLNQPPGATQALVNMRRDLLEALEGTPELARSDLDFQHLLRSWFNRGFLVLQPINWESPASILEKIVEYEAVHAISDWDDLRRRLYPQDRRCFAYFHPSMPDEPLIFVEVALTKSVPSSIQRLLSEERKHRDAQDTKVAVFYSISNCQKGLRGISFGNLLIKQVVAELQQELPGLETFVTLSPIPKLNTWLADQSDIKGVEPLIQGTADQITVKAAATHYLLSAKNTHGAPFDPVARFHLGNGAQIFAVHGAADLSENGLRQSGGAMVNYQYDLDVIEQNHEKFVQSGEVCISPAFQAAQQKSRPKRAAAKTRPKSRASH